MSYLKPMAWAMCVAFASFPGMALANAPQELAEIKAQIQALKAAYEARISALEKKLEVAEAATARPEPVPSPAPEARYAQTGGGSGNAFNPEVSLILQGQYKRAKDVAERGLTGFMPSDSHTHGGVADNNRRGYSVDHTELVLAANVDTRFRGQAILAIKDGETEVEESWFQTLGLGEGFGLRGGRYRSGIGYLNEQHPHQWDFADAPLMYQALFGYHGSYTQDGVQLKWLAPTPFFLELGAESGRGHTFPGNERNKNGSGSGALFAHVGGDVGLSHSWRTGVSYLRSGAQAREGHMEDLNGDEVMTKFSGRSRTVMADFIWKWAPNGNSKDENFKLQAEYFERKEDGNLNCADAGTTVTLCNTPVDSTYLTRQRGWYAQGVYQFTPHWRLGLRADRLNSGTRDFGINGANVAVLAYKPKRDSVMVDYSWSEFSRLRLQWARDQSMAGITDHQVVVQYIMSLGAHGAHKF